VVHRVIFEEQCHGEIKEATWRRLQKISQLKRMRRTGHRARLYRIIELPMTLGSGDGDSKAELPRFNTPTLHALAAVDFAFSTHH